MEIQVGEVLFPHNTVVFFSVSFEDLPGGQILLSCLHFRRVLS